jgi:carbon storage regulator
MLVLGRKPGEYIMIGDNIKVGVVRIDGELRMTIEAPRELLILRGEVYEKGNGKKEAS